MLLLLPQQKSGENQMPLFYSLISLGEATADISLPPLMRLFLAECIRGHLRDPAILTDTLALNWLQAHEQPGVLGRIQLQRTGNGALLLAGLFPERHRRLRVDASYFRAMGQAAYASLSMRLDAIGQHAPSECYRIAAQAFPSMEEILRAMRMNRHQLQ